MTLKNRTFPHPWRKTKFYRNTALSNTAQQVKTSGGDIYGWNLVNPNATDVYVKLYDGLLSNVSVGTTAPKTIILVPAGAEEGHGLNFLPVSDRPQEEFLDRIVIASVTDLADNSNSAPVSPIYSEVRYV